MEKISMILIGLLVIGGMLFIFFYGSKEQEEPEILSQLVDNGNINGNREFLFSITNVGANKATLEFPTWLEYNVGIMSLDNKEIPSGQVILENIDLNENDKDGRTLVLEPNQKTTYKVLVKNNPKGNYEITIGSALGYGEVQRKEFIID